MVKKTLRKLGEIRREKKDTFSLASLMQLRNNSMICAPSRQEFEGEEGGGERRSSSAIIRRTAAARAARAWARSSLSSLEAKKKGLVGDWRRVEIEILRFCCGRGFGLRVSAISVGLISSIGVFELWRGERKEKKKRGKMSFFWIQCSFGASVCFFEYIYYTTSFLFYWKNFFWFLRVKYF